MSHAQHRSVGTQCACSSSLAIDIERRVARCRVDSSLLCQALSAVPISSGLILVVQQYACDVRRRPVFAPAGRRDFVAGRIDQPLAGGLAVSDFDRRPTTRVGLTGGSAAAQTLATRTSRQEYGVAPGLLPIVGAASRSGLGRSRSASGGIPLWPILRSAADVAGHVAYVGPARRARLLGKYCVEAAA